MVGLEHKPLLVGSRKEFGNIQISQNPRFIVLVHFGMVTSLFEHLLLAKKNHASCGVDQFVSQIVGLWFPKVSELQAKRLYFFKMQGFAQKWIP